MDEVDVGVRFQDVAPHALTRVRFARHQQHLELVAHAVDRHHRLVVQRGQLTRDRRDVDLDHVGTGMVDPDRDVDPLPDGGRLLRHHHTVAPDRHGHGFAAVARIEHP